MNRKSKKGKIVLPSSTYKWNTWDYLITSMPIGGVIMPKTKNGQVVIVRIK